MKNLLLSAILASASLFGAVQAQAATLGLTAGTPALSASVAMVDFFAFPPDGDLSAALVDVDAATDIPLPTAATLGFGIGFTLADPTDTPTGGFDIANGSGLLLAGDLIDVGFVEDVIELHFGTLTGSLAADFGSAALMVITFDDPGNALDANPFDGLVDGQSYGASITVSAIDTTPIPLPAGAVLLMGGIGLLALRRRAG